MARLTDEQVLAAASEVQLVNIVSAPGSGKTTVAAERFGYQRYRRVDSRGVLGLSFTVAAAGELRSRIVSRWGSRSTMFPHCVSTFDEFHVQLFQWLLDQSLVHWPGRVGPIEVHDNYSGFNGYRWLGIGNWCRHAALNNQAQVYSKADKLTKSRLGISTAADHKAILNAGECSHEDLRILLWEALERDDVWSALIGWMSVTYSDLIVDEIYDAAELDLLIAGMAGQAGLTVTVIGDPWQAVYGWRGATPGKVSVLLDQGFEEYSLSKSFRFQGGQMPALAAALRNGEGVELPSIDSNDVEVAIARQWQHLLPAGDNVLPLAFRTIGNRMDAMLNLLLDTVTRAHLGRSSFGREGAIVQLGLDRQVLEDKQEATFRPILELLTQGGQAEEVMEQLRTAISLLGGRKPNRLAAVKQEKRAEELRLLGERLRHGSLIPGLTVHQAKGCEWTSVGVVLTPNDAAVLSNGLQPLTDDHCILYVALTRAKEHCGRLIAEEAESAALD
jgi:DNA helicase II / ATP-dependent DNA helicase PcrA